MTLWYPINGLPTLRVFIAQSVSKHARDVTLGRRHFGTPRSELCLINSHTIAWKKEHLSTNPCYFVKVYRIEWQNMKTTVLQTHTRAPKKVERQRGDNKLASIKLYQPCVPPTFGSKDSHNSWIGVWLGKWAKTCSIAAADVMWSRAQG